MRRQLVSAAVSGFPCSNRPTRRALVTPCLLCYANGRGRANYKGHAFYRRPQAPARVYVESPMKRPSEAQAARAAAGCLADEAFAKKYPSLTEYLTTTAWEDGAKREPSTLSLKSEAGVWNLGVNDKALERTLWTTAPTLADALRLAEKALAEGVDAWRPWKGKKR